MDSDSIKIIVLAVLIILSAYFSATETAFNSINKIRLKNMINNGNKRAKLVMDLMEDYDRLLATILIGNNFVNIAASAIATVLFISKYKDMGATIATIVVTVVILLFGEITPKSIAKDYPEAFAMKAAPFLRAVLILLHPINIFFAGWRKLLSMIIKTPEDKGITEEELITMVEEAQNDGELDSNESELIKNAIEFNDIEVIDIHTNRVDVVAVDISLTYSEIEEIFTQSGYSRLPVYEETIDNVVGVLNQKDFFNVEVEDFDIKKMMSAPVFVIPSMKISELLALLQKQKSHLAIITDEYGGTVGIVTLEDILEELVGEIYDEHDEVIEHFQKISEDEYKVLCSADLDDLFELFEIDEETDITTVGGWVIDELGEIPKNGDSFNYKNLLVTVTDCDDRHVLEVDIKVLPREEEDEEE